MTAKLMKECLMMEKERTKAVGTNLDGPREKLSSAFIVNSDGEGLKLFSFSRMDFKLFCSYDGMTTPLLDYMLLVLHLIYTRCLEVVQMMTSPDVDISKFSEILVKNLEGLRKHIPRCDKAFNKIRDSVDLMKSNFTNYYKDFVSSNNPSIIMENFILDVSNSTSTDLETTQQFKKIIEFYTSKMRSENINDPRIKKMISAVNENMNILR